MPADLQVRRLTAAGRGAVAVLEVIARSENAAERLSRHFSAANGRHLTDAAVGRILYGDWTGEDVVLVRTAADRWEIHCHGGTAAVRRIAEDLTGRDAVAADEAALTDDPLPAAVLRRLLNCRTKQTAVPLLRQYQGTLRNFLLQLCAVTDRDRFCEAVGNFLHWTDYAEHLTEPRQVAIVGRPNSGKSSLLNAFVGFDRSIVSEQPGTTRDRVETDLTLDGFPYRLSDTAGIRPTSEDYVESLGMQAAQQSLAECNACLIVVDSVIGWTETESDLLQRIPNGIPVAALFNKTDLLKSANTASAVDNSSAATADVQNQSAFRHLQAPSSIAVFPVSARTGEGIPPVLTWLTQTLIPEHPGVNEPLPVVPELTQVLRSARTEPDYRRLQSQIRERFLN